MELGILALILHFLVRRKSRDHTAAVCDPVSAVAALVSGAS